ncbi:hypothetical protein GEMRC1_009577 [Eukaryota sp. GEM-RC1]
MSHPLINSLDHYHPDNVTSLSAISSSKPSSNASSSSCFVVRSPSRPMYFQQTLLTLVDVHLLNHLLASSLEWKRDEPRRSITYMMNDVLTFFKKVGYVSDRFFESALLATNVFLQTNTFHVTPQDLPQICSFASLFGAEVRSVFPRVDGTFKVEEMLSYSSIISGLELTVGNPNDLEFLNKSSLFFPNLKELHIDGVLYLVFMSLMESLKVNDTVTSINLSGNYYHDELIIALADMLKVNARLAIVNLSGNNVGCEGIRALAEALKINTSVTSVDLSANSIEDESVRDLAEMLKVNARVTNVNLSENNIRNQGITALAEALKVNTTVTSVDLSINFIEDEGARALADMLKVNTTVTSVDVSFNSIGDEGARALAEMLKVNRKVKIVEVNLLNLYS